MSIAPPSEAASYDFGAAPAPRPAGPAGIPRARRPVAVGGGMLSETVAHALDGDESAIEALVDLLTPIVHRRVVRVLRRRRPSAASGRILQEAQDFTQEILCALFSGRRLLADWRPERGLGLESFVDMIARRRTLSALDIRRRDPWQEDPTLDERLDGPSRLPDPERRAVSAEMLERLLDRLQATLSPDSWHLFELVWIEELGVQEVARRKGMGTAAVYARISRIRKWVHQLEKELSEVPA
ncbi:MAG: sigma-70 family RNA polymerase sigma factor [Holophagales bacterium]|nr:sigma-70 family RNA polymerase sigma factor [Holophagales bacterium]